jgi:hypothetical protein
MRSDIKYIRLHPSRNLRGFGAKSWRTTLQKNHHHNPSYVRIGIGSEPPKRVPAREQVPVLPGTSSSLKL